MSKRLLLAVVPSFVALPIASAQVSSFIGPINRHSLSIAFSQSRPQADLRQNIGFGYGVDLNYQYRVDPAGILSLRIGAGFLGYGREQYDTPLSTTVGGRIQVRVTTTNSLMPVSIGPQLTFPVGPFRPYVNAGYGGQYFSTSSSVKDRDEDEDIASTTNQSDWTSAWVAGGGVYVPLSVGKTPISLDFGAQYNAGGRAQYLRPGSIEDLPDGEIILHTLESETRLILVRAGIRIGF